MLKRLLTVTSTNEILTSSVLDVADSTQVELNVGMDDEAFQKLLKGNKPGTKIKHSKLPFIKKPFQLVISTNGVVSYLSADAILIDYDLAFYDNENNLAVLDDKGNIVVHSKYILEKGKLIPNQLFEEPFIVV